MTVKDSAYLNWRYLDIPHKEFEIISLKKIQTGEILGFTILRETHSDVPVGQIIELVTPKNDNGKILRSLLRLAISHFYQKKKALVTCWMFSHCHSFPELIKLGFKRRETRTGGLFFRNWNLEDPAIQPEIAMKKENWYICMRNSD